jgi:hypothetical protein
MDGVRNPGIPDVRMSRGNTHWNKTVPVRKVKSGRIKKVRLELHNVPVPNRKHYYYYQSLINVVIELLLDEVRFRKYTVYRRIPSEMQYTGRSVQGIASEI